MYLKLFFASLALLFLVANVKAMKKPKKPITPAYMAQLIIKDKQEKLKQILGNTPNENHVLALSQAVSNKKINIAEWLLSIGTNTNAQYTFNNTLLHIAVENNDEIMVKLLIEHGANLRAQNKFWQTPLQTAHFHCNDHLANILTQASKQQAEKVSKKMVLLAQQQLIIDNRLLNYLVNNNPQLLSCQQLLALKRETIPAQKLTIPITSPTIMSTINNEQQIKLVKEKEHSSKCIIS